MATRILPTERWYSSKYTTDVILFQKVRNCKLLLIIRGVIVKLYDPAKSFYV